MKTQLEEQSSKYIDKKKAMKFRRMNIGNKNKRLEIIGMGKQGWNRRRQRVFWQKKQKYGGGRGGGGGKWCVEKKR